MSKISRSLSWNTRRKQKKDAGENANENTQGAGQGSVSTNESKSRAAVNGGTGTAGANGTTVGAMMQASGTPTTLRSGGNGGSGGDGGLAPVPTPRTMEVDSADLIDQDAEAIVDKGKAKQVRTWSFSRRSRRSADKSSAATAVEEAAAPEGSTKVYFLDGSCKLFEVATTATVGHLLAEVKARLGLVATNAFALYQVQRGTHYLLHENALISEIRSSTDSRAKALGIKERRPKLLFKKIPLHKAR